MSVHVDTQAATFHINMFHCARVCLHFLVLTMLEMWLSSTYIYVLVETTTHQIIVPHIPTL